MTYVLMIGGAILGWAFLRVVAGAREQQIRDLTWKIAAQASESAKKSS